jgi:murein DD-endopeptidase MepM/ murein hydrolase activator NlpD
MKRAIKLITILAILLTALITTRQVLAYPSGWRLPMYDSDGFSEGRAVISNGPGEGMHTGVDAQAIDYFSSGDSWYTNRNVHATHAGTVMYAGDAGCPGIVVGIQEDNGKASLYYHLSSPTVNVDDWVDQGQVIGYWSDSGEPECVQGAHLHFTARQDVDWNDPISSGTSLIISDLPGTGWYPWWPNAARNSGFVVQSTTHSIVECSTNRTISVRWPPTSWVEGGSNIDGYSWTWSTSSTTIPDNVKDGEETVTSTSKYASNGTWYFHIKVRDNSGNWSSNSEVAHLGPFWIASTCPTFSGSGK